MDRWDGYMDHWDGDTGHWDGDADHSYGDTDHSYGDTDHWEELSVAVEDGYAICVANTVEYAIGVTVADGLIYGIAVPDKVSDIKLDFIFI